MADLWSMIVPDENVEETPVSFPWSEWGTLFSTDSKDSFKGGDEMGEGNMKLAHAQGVVA